MSRILAIEDDADLQQVLEYNLREAGHDVLLATTGREGLELARSAQPDLILLDLMLPDIQGTEVCKALGSGKETSSIPIIMLTAKSEEIDRIIGFELGAADYVSKPFSLRELLLRIRAVLRRDERPVRAPARTEIGCLKIDREAHRAWVRDREIELTALEFRLLVTLLDRRGRVQSRHTLLDTVWGFESRVHERTVDAHVKRLRHTLGDARSYIQTVRGVGYRFEGPHEAAREIDEGGRSQEWT